MFYLQTKDDARQRILAAIGMACENSYVFVFVTNMLVSYFKILNFIRLQNQFTWLSLHKTESNIYKSITQYS